MSASWYCEDCREEHLSDCQIRAAAIEIIRAHAATHEDVVEKVDIRAVGAHHFKVARIYRWIEQQIGGAT